MGVWARKRTGRSVWVAVLASASLSVGAACGSSRGNAGAAGTGPGAAAGAGGANGHDGGACTSGAPCGGGQGGLELMLGGSTSHAGSAGAVASSGNSAGGSGGASGLCQPPSLVAPGCVAEVGDGSETLCNGLDDDCDGSIDEGCPCSVGAVQPCFRGPPARRNVGACADGTQTCRSGSEFAAHWGECSGGLEPSAEACDGLDNDCNGCADDLDGCTPKDTCPGPGDPRTPDGVPLAPYPLRGRDFFSGAAATWSWTVQGGPCDAFTQGTPSFGLEGASSETATFTPRLSGDYTVTLTVTPVTGPPFTCTWIVHIEGPGLRVEMCYPESSVMDLDLYLKQPGHPTPWFTAEAQFSTALDQCSWANCEANLRGDAIVPTPPQPVTRADWGYPNSPLPLCENDLQGAVWQTLGYCSSPRLDIDNNLSEATGVPENINVDAPRDNETFRIMVANFSGTEARPLVNVYCDGRRVATLGAAPDQLTGFSGTPGSLGIGALWRAADVTTHVTGGQTRCTVNVVHPPGASSGFDVTFDDPRY